jgi:hypothetical protein
MKLKLLRSGRHGAVAILMLGGITACGDVEPNPKGVSFTRQLLSTNAITVADATIMSGVPNQGTAINCLARNESVNYKASCLLRWDLSHVPPGSTVDAASIRLQVLDSSTQAFTAYKLLPSWSESNVNWTNRAAGTPWQQPGATGPADRITGMGGWSLSSTGSVTLELDPTARAIVKSWIDNPASNFGLSVASASNNDAISIATREHPTSSYRPKLTVDYTAPGGGGMGGGPGTGGSSTGGTFGGRGP